MRYLKTSGLVGIVAMAFMAWLGAGPASANLCTETPAGEVKCPEAERVDAGHNAHIQAQFTHGEIFTVGNTGNPLVTCTQGKLTATMSSGTTAAINTLDFEECEGSKAPTTILWGQIHFKENVGTHTGTVQLTQTKITINVLGVSCAYGVTGASSFVLGSFGGSTLTVNATLNKVTGSFLCPAEVGWDTSVHLETPSNIYWIPRGTG